MYLSKHYFRITAIFLAILIGLSSCKSLPESMATETLPPTTTPLPTLVSTPIILPKPEPLPAFLGEVRPFPSSVISQQEFHTTVIPPYVQEGPPPPPVEITGYNSSICVYLEVETLSEPGDSLVWDEEVLPRTTVAVNGNVLTDRGETEYLAVIEPPPTCKCFFDCENWEYPDWSNAPIPDNLGCWFWPGFWSCYPVELEPGHHMASFSFSRTSGFVEECSWVFGIVE
jgi:hypothetical protein